ncbi:MAG: hypothetical protein VX498_10830 [Myxococcota bacterium]|nr:hypothetical protein [Myxococcota bacterium]
MTGVLTMFLFAAVVRADPPKKRVTVSFSEADEGSLVFGRVHRPQVAYIITRPELEDLEVLQLKEDFIKKILESVEKPPF